MLPMVEAVIGVAPESEASAMGNQLISIGKEMCGLPPASRRARKMTDAPPVDASKVHKLAAAMLRSTKTMAHRLAQVAVSQPQRLPAPPAASPPAPPLPSPPLPSTTSHLNPPTAPITYLLRPSVWSYHSRYVPTVSPLCRPAGWASRRAPMERVSCRLAHRL